MPGDRSAGNTLAGDAEGERPRPTTGHSAGERHSSFERHETGRVNHASNVLVDPRDPGWRVCPVDWETAGHGPGLIDLAALAAGNWTDEQRSALVRAYQAALGEAALPETTLATALDCCRLHLAVQWLGWSADWAPPREHAQDWLGEAMAAATRLGL